MADLTDEQQNQSDLESERMPYQKTQEEQAAQQNPPNQGKMGWGIFLGALVLSLIADICEILVVGLPLVLVIDIILGFMLGFSAGARKQWKKWIAGFLPVPLLRVALLIWSFLSSRPKLIGFVQKVLK